MKQMVSPILGESNGVTDEELVNRAQSGDKEAVEALVKRHLLWVFNLAVRMLRLHADAEDAAQEIMMKAVQALPAFRGESKVRTWLYRIAVNHILNVKKSNNILKTEWSAADSVCSFDQAASGLRQVPDLDLPDPRTVPVPVELLVEETKIHCMIGTLLCLDGRQRLVFILGEIFGVDDEVGAEIAEITPVNFRQILSRARRDLYQYLRGNCSLVNSENHCKCTRKTQAFIKSGFVDPQKLEFTKPHLRKVCDVASSRADKIGEAYIKAGAAVYRNHPFYEPAEQVAILRRVLSSISLQTPS